MSNFSIPSDGRFVSSPSEILVGQKSQSEGSIAIIDAIIASTPNDFHSLLKGLMTERENDRTLDSTWKVAEKFYEQEKVTKPFYLQPNNGVKEYHVALIVYVLKLWYPTFNETTRKLTSIKETRHYPYKNYFKLLLLATLNVRGSPNRLPNATKLYRGISGHVSCKVGSWIAFQHFTSTSKDLRTALAYAGKGNRTLFVISGIVLPGSDDVPTLGVHGCPSAICLDHIAPHNQECLIRPYQFTVEKIEKETDGLRIVSLATFPAAAPNCMNMITADDKMEF